MNSFTNHRSSNDTFPISFQRIEYKRTEIRKEKEKVKKIFKILNNANDLLIRSNVLYFFSSSNEKKKKNKKVKVKKNF